MSGYTSAAATRALAAPLPEDISLARSTPFALYLFFFVSGFPALLYQIVWQRALFTLYGVNVESVTMVVSAFMVGLGLGSLLGGRISRSQHLPLLRVFGVVELLIASYGIVSLRVFHWAADFTAGSAPLQTGITAFGLVVVPTVLMGSTLPILVTYAVRLSHNVGTSVGALYAANTLGSAAACFSAGVFLMRWLGESKSVMLAAGLNAFLGATVLVWHLATRERQTARNEISSVNFPNELPTQHARGTTNANVPVLPEIGFPSAVITAGIAGFVSLGYEIVWYQLFSFTTGGIAKSFAFLLGAYSGGDRPWVAGQQSYLREDHKAAKLHPLFGGHRGWSEPARIYGWPHSLQDSGARFLFVGARAHRSGRSISRHRVPAALPYLNSSR